MFYRGLSIAWVVFWLIMICSDVGKAYSGGVYTWRTVAGVSILIVCSIVLGMLSHKEWSESK